MTLQTRPLGGSERRRRLGFYMVWPRFAAAHGPSPSLPLGQCPGLPPPCSPVIAVIDGRQHREAMVARLDGTLAAPASWWQTDRNEATVEYGGRSYVLYRGLKRAVRLLVSHAAMIGVCEARVARHLAETAMFCLLAGHGVPATSENPVPQSDRT